MKENSLKKIWNKNKADQAKNSKKRFAWLHDGSLFAAVLWVFKICIMMSVVYTVGALGSSIFVPMISWQYYAALFKGEVVTNTAMLFGSWMLPLAFFVGVVLFASCAGLVLFWRWLSALFNSIVAGHKAKIVAKTASVTFVNTKPYDAKSKSGSKK